MLKWLLVGLFLLLILALAVPRMVSDDPSRWHVDPGQTDPRGTPNEYLLAGDEAVFLPLEPLEALLRFDAVAQADARTGMIAGGFADGHATYVQRSALFGFPDYISVRARPVEGGSELSVYSRSRFGYSDLGANKARIERWLEELRSNRGTN